MQVTAFTVPRFDTSSIIPKKLERVNGIAPSPWAWQAHVLLLNYTRKRLTKWFCFWSHARKRRAFPRYALSFRRWQSTPCKAFYAAGFAPAQATETDTPILDRCNRSFRHT